MTRARLSVSWEVWELHRDLYKQIDNKQNRFLNFMSDSEYIVRTADKDIPCSVEALKFSLVFEKMMESDMSGVIDLTGVLDTKTAEDLVSFLSTGRAPNIESTCLDLLKAADWYHLEELKVLCQIELVKSLKVDNATQLLLVAYKFLANWLQKHSHLFIKANFQEVCLTEGWKSMDEMTRLTVEECLMK